MKRVLKTAACTLLLAAPVALTACSSSADSEITVTGNPVYDLRDKVKPISLTQEQRDLTHSCNAFAFDLLRTIDRQEADGKNRFLSPMSVGYVLGMLHSGAAGQTRQQINRVAGFQGATPEVVNFYYQKLSENLPKVDPTVNLRTANAIYTNSALGITLKDAYQQAMQTYYQAQVKGLDYTKSASLSEINSWCSKQTDGMISKMLDRLDPATVCTLINAIYFKATWTEKFDEKDTRDATFTAAGNKQKLPMMHRLGRIRYAENDLFRMIQLPYGAGQWAMRVLLPTNGHSADDIVAALGADSFDGDQLQYETADVDILLPRFECDTKMELIDVLKSMGMPLAFDANAAEFPDICDQGNLYISRMLQKARIEVSEEGTKAAAVTVAEASFTSASEPQFRRIDFHCTQPFVYLITERSSDAVCFVGKFTGK